MPSRNSNTGRKKETRYHGDRYSEARHQPSRGHGTQTQRQPQTEPVEAQESTQPRWPGSTNLENLETQGNNARPLESVVQPGVNYEHNTADARQPRMRIGRFDSTDNNPIPELRSNTSLQMPTSPPRLSANIVYHPSGLSRDGAAFVQIGFNDFRACCRFVEEHENILQESTSSLIREAVEAYKKSQGSIGDCIAQRIVMLHHCQSHKLGKAKAVAYIEKLNRGYPEGELFRAHEEAFLKLVTELRKLAGATSLASTAQPRPVTQARPSLQSRQSISTVPAPGKPMSQDELVMRGPRSSAPTISSSVPTTMSVAKGATGQLGKIAEKTSQINSQQQHQPATTQVVRRYSVATERSSNHMATGQSNPTATTNMHFLPGGNNPLITSSIPSSNVMNLPTEQFKSQLSMPVSHTPQQALAGNASIEKAALSSRGDIPRLLSTQEMGIQTTRSTVPVQYKMDDSQGTGRVEQKQSASQVVKTTAGIPPTLDTQLVEFKPENTFRGHYEGAYYQRRTQDAKNFFKPGRIFRMVFPESAGSDAKSTDKNIVVGPNGVLIHVKDTWMCSVAQKTGYCITCPIKTYGYRALTKPSLTPREIRAHAIIYSEGRKATRVQNEPQMVKDPIMVKMSPNRDPLHYASRVDFGKSHTVHWHANIMDMGRVVEDHREILQGYFRHEMQGP